MEWPWYRSEALALTLNLISVFKLRQYNIYTLKQQQCTASFVNSGWSGQ